MSGRTAIRGERAQLEVQRRLEDFAIGYNQPSASQGVLLYTSKEKHSLTRKLVEYFGTKACTLCNSITTHLYRRTFHNVNGGFCSNEHSRKPFNRVVRKLDGQDGEVKSKLPWCKVLRVQITFVAKFIFFFFNLWFNL